MGPADPVLRTDLGCARDVRASTLNRLFQSRWGPLIGFDNAHVMPLGRGRHLWLFTDAFLDYSGVVTDFRQSRYQHNVAVLQRGKCFTLLHRNTRAFAYEWEPGDMGRDSHDRFFWPLGGERIGRTLYVFWAEMHNDYPPPAPEDGITRHPERTWLATYDVRTLRRQSFVPAPNSGVFPQYGFAVESDRTHTYLFGNSNLLNFAREGGYMNGPHSATRMYLARVPRGRLTRQPAYRTATGWSPDPGDARAFSSRFWAENQMQPRLMNGVWVSTTKIDGFSGLDVLVEVADEPWGPWREVRRFRTPTTRNGEPITMYQPILVPWREPNGRMSIVLSRNAHDWDYAVSEDNSVYRPEVTTVPWVRGEQAG
ncbi:MAG: hypothetical protein H0U21_04715 [Acidimicrobiia bacterium]|nr:hypothetical protein [Acidimicrobiia bacterium]